MHRIGLALLLVVCVFHANVALGSRSDVPEPKLVLYLGAKGFVLPPNYFVDLEIPVGGGFAIGLRVNQGHIDPSSVESIGYFITGNWYSQGLNQGLWLQLGLGQQFFSNPSSTRFLRAAGTGLVSAGWQFAVDERLLLGMAVGGLISEHSSIPTASVSGTGSYFVLVRGGVSF